MTAGLSEEATTVINQLIPAAKGKAFATPHPRTQKQR